MYYLLKKWFDKPVDLTKIFTNDCLYYKTDDIVLLFENYIITVHCSWGRLSYCYKVKVFADLIYGTENTRTEEELSKLFLEKYRM